MERPTSYTDSAGTLRQVRVDIDTVERIRASLGVDLLRLNDETVMARLADPVALVRMLHQAVDPRAGWAEFAAAHIGDAIEAAEAAFTEALIRFFPSRRQTILRGIRQTQEAALDRLLSTAETALATGTISQEIAAELQHQLPPILRPLFEASAKPSTASPDNSALTPDPARSANSAG